MQHAVPNTDLLQVPREADVHGETTAAVLAAAALRVRAVAFVEIVPVTDGGARFFEMLGALVTIVVDAFSTVRERPDAKAGVVRRLLHSFFEHASGLGVDRLVDAVREALVTGGSVPARVDFERHVVDPVRGAYVALARAFTNISLFRQRCGKAIREIYAVQNAIVGDGRRIRVVVAKTAAHARFVVAARVACGLVPVEQIKRCFGRARRGRDTRRSCFQLNDGRGIRSGDIKALWL